MKTWIPLVIALCGAQGCMVRVPVSTRPISAEIRVPPQDPREGRRRSETPEPTELAAAAEGEIAPTPGTPQAAGIGDGIPGNLGDPAGQPDGQPNNDGEPGEAVGAGIVVSVAPEGGIGPIDDAEEPERRARAAEEDAPAFDPFRSPGQVRVRWIPFVHPKVLVIAPGYRRMTIPLKVGMSALWGRPRAIELVLIPNHGPSGTWTEEDVP